MDFAYRLDMTIDLFEMTVAGATVVMSQDELRAAKQEAAVNKCVSSRLVYGMSSSIKT